MKRMETIVLLMLIAFLGWHSNIVNSAAISQDRPLVPPKIQTNDEKALQLNMQLFREAVGDYAVSIFSKSLLKRSKENERFSYFEGATGVNF